MIYRLVLFTFSKSLEEKIFMSIFKQDKKNVILDIHKWLCNMNREKACMHARERERERENKKENENERKI